MDRRSLHLMAALLTSGMLASVKLEDAADPTPSKPERTDGYRDGHVSRHGHVQLLRARPKTGRNDPCPCSSGKKFKHCHGARP